MFGSFQITLKVIMAKSVVYIIGFASIGESIWGKIRKNLNSVRNFASARYKHVAVLRVVLLFVIRVNSQYI